MMPRLPARIEISRGSANLAGQSRRNARPSANVVRSRGSRSRVGLRRGCGVLFSGGGFVAAFRRGDGGSAFPRTAQNLAVRPRGRWFPAGRFVRLHVRAASAGRRLPLAPEFALPVSESSDGRPCCQTARAHSAWARLGLQRRGPESLRRSRLTTATSSRSRTVATTSDRERDLQFEIANRRAPFLAPEAGPRSRFFPAPHRAGDRVSRAARDRSAALPARLERERRPARRDRRSLRRLSRAPDADARDGSAKRAYR